MKLYIENTYEAISAKAADDILRIVHPMKNALLCTASGDSPKGLYSSLIRRVKEDKTDISNWRFVGLDEWVGMNGSDQGSCRHHLNRDLFAPMGVADSSICFFDGRNPDSLAEVTKTDDFINTHGGIDIAIVGLGMNGHVGMNEPGTDPTLHSHLADIDPSTQAVGQKYFTKKQALTQGMTLGIANLMEARNVLLIVSGQKKSSIVQQVLQAPVTEQLPASLLRNHKNLFIYLDEAAARLLQKSNL